MRQDPPFDMAYITATHLLEHVSGMVLVVNDPVSVRNAPEKLFATHFTGLMPETLISSDAGAIRDFRKQHGDIILKPLFGNGGAGVFHLRPEDENLNALLEMFTQLYREPVIAQRYLPEVRRGDKRIILVEGEPVGAVLRVPAEGEARANLHVGGKAQKSNSHQARPRNLRRHRPPAARARARLRRHRRDRRLSHRNQRHLADRHPGNQPARRRQARSQSLGRDRGAAEEAINGAPPATAVS